MKNILFSLTLNSGFSPKLHPGPFADWLRAEQNKIEILLERAPSKSPIVFEQSIAPVLDLIRKNDDAKWAKIILAIYSKSIRELKSDSTPPVHKKSLLEFKNKLINYFIKSPVAKLNVSHSILSAFTEHETVSVYQEIEKKYNFSFSQKLYSCFNFTRQSSLQTHEYIIASLLNSATTPLEQAQALISLCVCTIPTLISHSWLHPLDNTPQLERLINDLIIKCESLLPVFSSSSIVPQELYNLLTSQDFNSVNNIMPSINEPDFNSLFALTLEKQLLKTINRVDPVKFEQKYLQPISPLFSKLDFSDIENVLCHAINHNSIYLSKIINSLPQDSFSYPYPQPTEMLLRCLWRAISLNNLDVVELLMPQNRTPDEISNKYPFLSKTSVQLIFKLEGQNIIKDDLLRNPNAASELVLKKSAVSSDDKISAIEYAWQTGNTSLYNQLSHWGHVELPGFKFFELIKSVLGSKHKNEELLNNQKEILKDMFKKEAKASYYLTSHKKGLIELSPDLIDYLTALDEKQQLSQINASHPKALKEIEKLKHKI